MINDFRFSNNSVYKTEYNLVYYTSNLFTIQKIKYCRQKGFELIKKGFAEVEPLTTDVEEVKRISLSRTKRRLREICLCNNFTHFVTFTVASASDRFSLDNVQDELKKINKAIKRKYKDYSYVFVTEKHENGAFHFHGLIKGLSIGNGLEYNDHNFLTIPMYSDKVGFDCIKEIDVADFGYEKLCSYIQKYISKDMCKKYNGQLYFCSKGLKRADRYLIKDVPKDIDWDFENDFVCIKDFDLAHFDDLSIFNIKEKNFLDILLKK